MQTHFLKALYGDAIWITYADAKDIPRNIIIDGGPSAAYVKKNKKGKLEYGALSDTIALIKEREQKIDLLVLTHVDDDHIKGLLAWIEYDADAISIIEKVWFNSGRLIFEFFKKTPIEKYALSVIPNGMTNTGISEGVTFEKLIKEKTGIWDHEIIMQGQTILLHDLKFRILSPDKAGLEELLTKWEEKEPESLTAVAKDYAKSLNELLDGDKYVKDPSVHNGSSIAFILTFKDKNLLFLADAHCEKVVAGLEHFGYTKEDPLVCEFVKVSHHGSKYNTNDKVLECVSSQTFVISSDGTDHSPYKRTLARIINAKKQLSLYFNYWELSKDIFLEEDFKAYPNLSILPKDHEFII